MSADDHLPLLYVGAGLISWVLIAGMLFNSFQSIGCEGGYNIKSKRQDAGMAVFVGAIGVPLWPLMLPAIYCITGFAEFGAFGGACDKKAGT